MLTRRMILLASGAMGLGTLGARLPGVNAATQPASSAAAQGLIDMHCHVFNATDLPIQGYLRYVIFKAWPQDEVPLALLTSASSGNSAANAASRVFLGPLDLNTRCDKPGTRSNPLEQENLDDPWWQHLSTLDVAAREKLSLAAADFCYERVVSRAMTAVQELRELLSNPQSLQKENGEKGDRDPRQEIRGEYIRFFGAPGSGVADRDVPIPEDRQSKQQVDTDRKAIEGRALLRDWLIQRSARSNTGDEAGDAADVISESSDYFSRQFKWVEILKAPRSRLSSIMSRTYEASDHSFSLYAPALIDYSKWIDSEPSAGSSLAEQGATMGQISVVTARSAEEYEARNPGKNGIRFHGYMAFDPLRDFKESGSARRTLEQALNTQGFLGSKVYPTMGFLPWGNATTAGMTFSKRVLARQVPVGSSQSTVQGYSTAELAQGLDASLMAFYELSERLDAPILAHATASYGAGPNYECRAHPFFWEPVVRKYRGLRVCLAHFGDFAEALQRPAGVLNWFSQSVVQPQLLGNTWEAEIARIIGDGATNLYFDVSYFAEVMDDSPSSRLVDSMVQNLATLIRRVPALPAQMLYGTDWLLLAREKNAAKHYEDVRRFLTSTFDMANGGQHDITERWLKGVFRDNAIRFLGLKPNSGARRRIERFYAMQAPALRSDWLNQFN